MEEKRFNRVDRLSHLLLVHYLYFIFFHPLCVRRPGEESDAESSRESSSDGSADYGAEQGANSVARGPWSHQKLTDVNTQNMNRLSLRNKPLMGSPGGEGEVSNPPSILVFQYLEQDSPYGREPLADKVSAIFTWRFCITFANISIIITLHPTDFSSCV